MFRTLETAWNNIIHRIEYPETDVWPYRLEELETPFKMFWYHCTPWGRKQLKAIRRELKFDCEMEILSNHLLGKMDFLLREMNFNGIQQKTAKH